MKGRDHERERLVKKDSFGLEKERSARGQWSLKNQRYMTALYFCGSVLVYSARTAMALCMPDISEELNLNKQQQGTVLSCFLWGYPLTQIAGGYFADRLGGGRVILVAGFAWVGVTVATPLFVTMSHGNADKALSLLIFSRVIQGFAQGLHYPATFSVVSKNVPTKERTFVYSFVGSGTHGGTLFTGLFGSIILNAAGWRIVFYSIGVLSFGWLAVFALYNVGDKTPVISMKEDLIAHSDSSHGKLPWGIVVKKSPFWAMLIAHFCEGYTFFTFLFWMPTFFHDTFPDAKPWLYNVLPWVIDMCVSIPAGLLADQMMAGGYSKTYTRKFLNIFAQLMMGLSLILLILVNSFGMTLLLLCLSAAGHGFYQSTVIMNPSDITPKHSGFMFGVMNTFGAIPGFLGTYISGAILQSTDNWDLMYFVTGFISVIGWAVFACYGSGEPIIK